MKGGLTLSIIFDASSANYGEGIGNISELKKLTKNNKLYTFISRQALRYDIFRILNDSQSIEAPLSKASGVVQFSPDANIKDHIEADLFGYMKTEKKQGATTRSAVVRFSPAVSLEAYNDDIEFAANHNFAKRVKDNPNPFQIENHSSLYTYTVTIDLDRIGKEDAEEKPAISNTARAERVKSVLDVIKLLNREIKGRVENFNPLFIIGGVYGIKNPYFLGRIKLDGVIDGKSSINTKILYATSESIKDSTMLGFVDGYFSNDFQKELPEISASSIESFFNELKKKVDGYYEGA